MHFFSKHVLQSLMALTVLVCICLFSFLSIMAHLRQMEQDGNLINLSGKQRMLSQRISYLAFRKASVSSAELRKDIGQELEASLDLMERAHTDLMSRPMWPELMKVYKEGDASLDRETRAFITSHREESAGESFSDDRLRAFLAKLDRAVELRETKNKRDVKDLIAAESLALGLGIVVVLFVGHLIYRQRRQEEMIARQREKLFAHSRLSSLGEMAGGLAHEINNPLAVISFSATNLRKFHQTGRFNETKALEAIDDIISTVRRISKIITGLRTISRETDGTKKEELPLRVVVDDVLSLCSERFRNNTVELVYDLEESPLQCKALYDRVQLSQVFLNLLNNAFDAVEASGQKRVRIQTEETKTRVLVKISDSGPGIPKAIREKIFQPFFTTKPIGKGTGLGLSLSHAILTAHGGTLTLDPQSPETCFIIGLPKA